MERYMNLKTTLLAAAASIGLAGGALAAPVTGQISLGGYVESINSTNILQATGLNFDNGDGTHNAVGTAGTLSSFGAGSGSFAILGSCNSTNCGSIADITTLATGAQTINQFLRLSANGETFTFNLSG